MNTLVGIAGLALAIATIGSAAAKTQPEAPRPSDQIYAERCAYCHDANGWGTRVLARRLPASDAVLLNRASLPPGYITFVVRHGIGAMPQFTPSEITDAELAELSRWLGRGN